MFLPSFPPVVPWYGAAKPPPFTAQAALNLLSDSIAQVDAANPVSRRPVEIFTSASSVGRG